MIFLVGNCQGFQFAHTSVRHSSLQCPPAAALTQERTTDLICRENYVPSWVTKPGDSAATSVYGEQVSEYEAYAKFLKEQEDSNTPLAAAQEAVPEPQPPPPAAKAVEEVPEQWRRVPR